MTTDKPLEAVADLIYETTGCTGDTARYLAQAAITAARPLIMDEAAGIAEAHQGGFNQAHDRLCRNIATAIRAAGREA